jgi:2-amino-4-hydroxy-6-hydroxymethyldihydropteridine diphosphokinase
MRLLVGLGGNLGDPPAAFRRALRVLAEHHPVLAISRIYRSEPEGPEQPRFFNMAAVVEVGQPILGFLDACLELESAAGRRRDPASRWGPRPLDIDLLMAPRLTHVGPRLQLPHRHFHRRGFALIPAAEVVPDWLHPTLHRPLAELAELARAAAPGAVAAMGGGEGQPSTAQRS